MSEYNNNVSLNIQLRLGRMSRMLFLVLPLQNYTTLKKKEKEKSKCHVKLKYRKVTRYVLKHYLTHKTLTSVP